MFVLASLHRYLPYPVYKSLVLKTTTTKNTVAIIRCAIACLRSDDDLALIAALFHVFVGFGPVIVGVVPVIVGVGVGVVIVLRKRFESPHELLLFFLEQRLFVDKSDILKSKSVYVFFGAAQNLQFGQLPPLVLALGGGEWSV